MIITKNDIDGFESALEGVVRRSRPYLNLYGTYYEGREAEHEFNGWLGENPQVLMAGANLQEFVAAHTLPLYIRMVNEGLILASKQAAFRPFNGRWLITSCRAKEEMWSYSLDTLQQALDQGDDEEVDRLIDSALIELPRAEDIINNAYKCLGNESLDPTTLVSPRLWTPNAQEEEKRLIRSAALPIIQAIQAEQCELGSLHWRQLEDIVAEILSKSGMEIHKVQSTPQGGRDIIARARLTPGEMITIAVEVKHTAVVDRPVLHTALHQNSQFSALMLVTSGRFSAGVVREAQKPENKLRLFLKDGVALGELIRSYMIGT